MFSPTSEIKWVNRYLEEFCVTSLQLVTLQCDNHSVVNIAHNPVQHDKTKHVAIYCHLIKEKVIKGLLKLTYLLITSQLVDVFTNIIPSS